MNSFPYRQSLPNSEHCPPLEPSGFRLAPEFLAAGASATKFLKFFGGSQNEMDREQK